MTHLTSPLKLRFTQNRWWIFQQERFPVFKYGLLIAVFSGSAVSYATLLQGRSLVSVLPAWGVAFVSVFGFFLQLRIADEFKDAEDDRRYRPDRPVPRGLVSLTELGILGVAIALVQLSVALWFKPQLVLLLVLVWGYFGLMGVEFFVRDWLKAHFTIYLLSHMVILPLIGLYATACADWLPGTFPSGEFIPFLILCFCNGMVIEIGRKIRSPADEQPGVQTYSALWQPGKAAMVWLGVMGCTAIAAIGAATLIQFTTVIVAISSLLYIIAAVIAVRFLQSPSRVLAAWIDRWSGVWTLLIYFSAGILPMLMQTEFNGR